MIEHADRAPAPLRLWQVASEPTNKHDLLLVRFSGVVVRDNISTAPEDIVRVDLSVSAVAFERATEYHAPSWTVLKPSKGRTGHLEKACPSMSSVRL